MTNNIEKIIEKHRERLNLEKGMVGALHLKWFAEEIRQETIEEIEREFQNKNYNLDPRLGYFLSKEGIISLIQSKKEKI